MNEWNGNEGHVIINVRRIRHSTPTQFFESCFFSLFSFIDLECRQIAFPFHSEFFFFQFYATKQKTKFRILIVCFSRRPNMHSWSVFIFICFLILFHIFVYFCMFFGISLSLSLDMFCDIWSSHIFKFHISIQNIAYMNWDFYFWSINIVSSA